MINNEKGKMTIVEFAEQVFAIKLLPYQKDFLEKVYDAVKNHRQIYYVPPRCNSRFSLTVLQALAVLVASEEEGIVKEGTIMKEENKTCGRCIHDEESADIVGSSCYLCKRNPEDHRIDWFEEKKEESRDA